MKIIINIIVLFYTLNSLTAQTKLSKTYKIDVKTSISNKSKLTAVKKGLIAYMSSDIYLKKVEFREDYSFWINDFKSKQLNDSTFTVYVDVDIAKPSMFSKNVLQNKLIEYTYTQKEVDSLMSNNSVAISKALTKVLSNSNILNTALTLTESVTQAYITAQSGGSSALVGGNVAVNKAFNMIRSEVANTPAEKDLQAQAVIGGLLCYNFLLQYLEKL